MLFVLLALRSIVKPKIMKKPMVLYKRHKEVPLERNWDWGKFWDGLKKGLDIAVSIFNVVKIFLSEDDNAIYVNGYKVTNVVAGEDGRPKEITLDNGVNKIVINFEINELASNKFSWASLWEGIKKVFEFISKLFLRNELTLDGDEVTFGDYKVTDASLNDEGIAQEVTLENESGNRIKFKFEFHGTVSN